MPEQGPPPIPDDEESAERLFTAPVPPLDDRLWRHPTEVAAARRAAAAEASDGSRRYSPFGLAVATAVGGGLLATGLWLLMGSTSSTSVAGAGNSPDATPAPLPVDTVVSPTTSIEQAVVELRTTDGTPLGKALALHEGRDLVSSLAIPPGTTIEATLPDGSTSTATVVGHDDLTGVSAVRLERGHVDGAATAPSPSELPRWLTTEMRADGWSHATMPIDDASLVPGDAVTDGGAVLALVTTTGDGKGATPIGVVARVADQLFESGTAAHPWLGIRGHDDGSRGVKITEVIDGSPAAHSGFSAGMHVTGIGDVEVSNMAELLTELRAHAPGDTVVIQVTDGSTRRIAVQVADTAEAPT